MFLSGKVGVEGQAGHSGTQREQPNWTQSRVSLPTMSTCFTLQRCFSSWEASETPRKHWSAGRRAENARRQHFCREPSPWQSHPASLPPRTPWLPHFCLWQDISPQLQTCTNSCPHTSTECLPGTPYWTWPKPAPYLPLNLHLSSPLSFSSQKPVIILEPQILTLPPKDCIQNLPISPPPLAPPHVNL